LGATARQAATANWFRSGLHWRSSSAGCRHRSPPPDECAVRRYLPTPSVPSARVRDGWDFVGQSWFQRSLKEVEDEEAEVRRSLARLEKLTGKRVRGWFGAGGGETVKTPEVLKRCGI